MRLFFAFAGFLLGASSVALADACDDTAARVSAAVSGMEFIGRDDKVTGSPAIRFKHRHAGTVEIFCGPSIGNVVTIDAPTPYPTKEFLAFVAKAGAAETGASAAAVQAALVKCHQRALRSPAMMDDVEIKGGEVHCVIYNEPDWKKTQFEIKKR